MSTDGLLKERDVSNTGLMRRPAVEAATGLSKSGLYRLVSEGRFPAPRRLGLRAVAWRADEIENWIESRPPVLAGGAR